MPACSGTVCPETAAFGLALIPLTQVRMKLLSTTQTLTVTRSVPAPRNWPAAATRAAALGAATLWLVGCGSSPPPTSAGSATAAAPAASVTVGGPAAKAVPAPSVARTPKEYRQDAARHLYQLNADRIYKGRLPPMLYAIGTLEVQVDRQGNVVGLNWMRAPKHAPEVVTEIERTARAAAPYPVPERLGRVTYTDTWLWHKSGRFQLDTLTEGQD